MLRAINLNHGYVNYLPCFRGVTTASITKKADAFVSEWDAAQPYSKIPGPSSFELFRNFLPGGKYYKSTFLQLQKSLRDEYGQLAKLPGLFGRRDVVFAFDPKDFEKVYRTEGQWPIRRGLDTFSHYRQNVRPDVFKNMGGLISEQGSTWGAMRSKTNPILLPPKTVKSYIPQVDEIACEFVDQLKASRDANNELPAAFGHELNKWALESIGALALDQRLGVLVENNPDAKLLIQSVKNFVRLSFEMEMGPSIWRYVETPKYKEIIQTFDNMTDLVLKYVYKKLDEIKAKGEDAALNPEASVLEKLLKIDKHLAVVMAIDMILAGIDTTAATTVGCLYHIAKNQDKQDKLREEIRRILPNANDSLTPESLNSAPYLRACFKEAARLSPIISGHLRAAGQDIVLKGFQIPKGIDVSICNILLQQDEANYPQGHKFLPERWLKSVEQANGCPSARLANPFIYLPFGFGARACIGKRFAEMEIETLLIRILRQHKLEWNYAPIEYVHTLILTPVGDLKFKMTELNE